MENVLIAFQRKKDIIGEDHYVSKILNEENLLEKLEKKIKR